MTLTIPPTQFLARFSASGKSGRNNLLWPDQEKGRKAEITAPDPIVATDNFRKSRREIDIGVLPFGEQPAEDTLKRNLRQFGY
jgi:hypothetical protein